jgi:phosphate transport system substrate-binding protein
MKNTLLFGIGLLVLSIVVLIYPPAESKAADDFSGQSITIAGTGDCQSLLRVLAKAFNKSFEDARIRIPDSIGSSGGIKALIDGKVDLARVARPLKPHEQKKGLSYHLFAKNPVVFVVHPDVKSLDNLDVGQIIDIYAGKTNRWEQLGGSQGKIYALTREPGDSSLSIINGQVPGFKDIAKSAAKVYFSTPETVEALVRHKNTIGFIPLTEVKGTGLRVIKVNAVSPSVENVTMGKYKLTTSFAIVSKGKLSGFAKTFVNYLYSAPGRVIITEFGAIPSN